ncbi:MAG: hypothetical protein IJ537_01805 [Bacteroidaceae bacterium]|nr:hypothetical protein [Bacteroidaceae bacterium]
MKKLFTFILATLCMASAWAADKTTSPFTGITVEDAVGRQDIFLYNVESGYFLQDNRRNWGIWTTGAQLASQGMLLGIEDAGDGKYYIKSPLNNARMGWSNNNPQSFYMDIAAGVALTFTTKAGVSNGYTIDDGTRYLHAAAENNAGSGGAKVGYQLAWDNAGVRNTWQIVTREERENYLKVTASKENPLDAAYLVGMPNVPRNVSIQGTGWGINNWTITRDGGSQNLINNNLWDMNAWTFDNVTSLNVSQTITGAPNGKYRARFYLMYSPTQIGNASEELYNDWAANGDATVKVVAYAGGQEAKAVSYYAVDRATVQAAGEYYTNDFRLNKQLGTRYFAEDWNWISRRMYVGDFKTDWIEFTVNNGTGTFDLGFKTIDGLDANSDIEFGGVELEYMGLDSPFTGITPAEAAGRSDIFFYNVESGLWMQANSRAWEFWTTHVQLDTQGLLMGLEADGSNYKIKSPFNPTGANKYLGSNLYLDNNAPVSWTMAAKELASVSNAFTIENGGNYLNASSADLSNDGDYRKRTGNLLNWDGGTRNTWQIVTRAEREAYILANATAETPLSVNYLVGRPYQTRTNVANNWTITRDGGNQALERNGLWNWNVSEYWNMNSLNVSQTVGNAPNGRYRARFYLMYSPTNAAGVGESYIDYPVKAVGYAGGNEVPAKSYYSEEKSTATFVTNNFNLTKEINGKYYVANWDEVARRMYCGGFLTDWVEFNVMNGTFDLGVKTIDGLDAESWVVFGGVELEYMGPVVEKEISLTNGYATFSAAESYKVTTEGVSAYKATSKSGNYIILTEISDIPANTGVVLYGEGKSNAVLEPVASATSDVTGNMLKPNVTATVLPQESEGCKNYILGRDPNNESVCVFRPTSGNGTLAAGRAYLALPIESSGVKYYIGFDDDDATSISLTPNPSPVGEGSIYNLAGQRLGKMQKGINIVNGKKILK